MENYTVIKRKKNGTRRIEPFNSEKILKHFKYACKDLNVDPFEIFSSFKIRLKQEMKSEEIQKAAIFTAADVIDKNNPDSQYPPARLMLQDLYKDIYGGYTPAFDSALLRERAGKGYYDKEIFFYYSDEEINELAKCINYDNDLRFTYLGLNQLIKKYSIKRDNKPIETPQEIFFLIPLYIFASIEDKEFRAKMVLEFYQALAVFDIFLPTPGMVGIRTNMKGWTSCSGLDFGDSIEAIANGSKSLYKLITKLRAGIGANIGNIRGLGADIGNGFEIHTGITPYAKANEAISRSSTQPNSGRSGAITNYYPFFHIEIEDILQLKNNKGSDEASVRHSDHAIVFDPLFRKRLDNDEDISLFFMNDVGELYSIIGTDEFEAEYLKYEKLAEEGKIFRKVIKASSLEDRYFHERYITARNYKVNARHMQEHSAFDLPVYTSNLCTEIALPSFPDEDYFINVLDQNDYQLFIEGLYKDGKWYQLYRFIRYGIIDEKNAWVVDIHLSFLDTTNTFDNKFTLNFGEIFSCILGGINFGNLSTDTEERKKQLEKNMFLMVYFLDEMIDKQDYQDIKPFEKFTKNRRALGISPGNYFYMLAKHGFNYDTKEARALTAMVFEEFLYYGLKASNEVAKEKGACNYFADTKYSKGILPIDTYEKNVDKLYDLKDVIKFEDGEEKSISANMWELLRKDIQKYGLRNSTLLTAVPSSNSSRPGNMISGINPPVNGAEYSIEDNNMKITAILPNSKEFEEFYTYNSSWNLDIIEYWKLIAIMQKFIDQAISINEYVDFTKYPNSKIPKSEVIRRDLFTELFGIKTLYYAKTKTDNDTEELQEVISDVEGCSGGGCTL